MTDRKVPRPTLRTLAEMTGVSHMAVSLALRNHPSIGEETKARIIAAANKVGYRPDPITAKVMARLRSGSDDGRVIAFVTHFTDDTWKKHPVYGQTYSGAVERAKTLGYKVEVFSIGAGGVTVRNLSRILHTRAIEGAVIGGLPHRPGHLSLDLKHLSAVSLGFSLLRPQLHRVGNHQIHSAQLALRKLRKLGSRRIGLVALDSANRRSDNNWVMGYLGFQNTLPEKQKIPAHTPVAVEFEAFRKWFRENKPDGIVALADEVPAFLKKMKVDVPGQVQFATLDRKIGQEEFSGVDQRHSLAGSIAIDLLMGELYLNERGAPSAPRTVLVEGQWADGKTTRQ